MAPVVEVVRFHASEAYVADHSVAVPPIKELTTVPGRVATYYGIEVQEPQYGYLINVWETLQDHENFKADKDNFHRILSEFGPSIGSEGIKYIRDVVSDIQDPHIALSAPVTEIAYWTLKEGTDSKVFQEKVDKLVKLAISWGSAAGIHPGGWGRIADDDKVYCVLLGWDSLEIFHKAIGASPEALVLIGELKELADLDLKHTIIKKH